MKAKTQDEIDRVINNVNKRIKKERMGHGIRRGRGRPVGSVNAPTTDKYVPFGDYLLHLPSLGKGFLSLRYSTSKQPIPKYPRKPLTIKLTEALTNLVEGGKLNKIIYGQLTNTERADFDKILATANCDKKLGIARKLPETRDLDLHEFDILKGEVEAGNDSPDVMRRLKMKIVKLVDEGVIDKRSAQKTLFDLMMLNAN